VEAFAMFDSPAEALKFIQQNDVAMVDLKVAGLRGQWLHVTIPASRFGTKHFEEGVGYDGSSGSGFAAIESGDVCARPDPSTAFIDPFWERKTLSFICDTVSADTRELLSIDPRCTLRRAVQYMRSTGIADEAWMAPEFEFTVYDRVELINEPYHTSVVIRSAERVNSGDAVPLPHMGGYMASPPSEQLHDLRSDIALTLGELGVPVCYHHHEVGAAGQCEVEIELVPLPRVADMAMLTKYVIKNVARRHNKLATFMPKPILNEPGNGMHVHQRLEKNGKPVFFDDSGQRYADMSDTGLQYIGGLLAHGQALTALTNPSTNSFKRLIEGYEAPVALFFSLANRSAAIRIPRYAKKPASKRIEYRPGDFTCNIYYALAAMLMAGLDGVRQRIDVAARHFGPFDVDISHQPAEFRAKIDALPRSLMGAMAALQADCDFLLAGEVFTQPFIDAWCTMLRRQRVDAVAHRPHPFEFQLYLDC